MATTGYEIRVIDGAKRVSMPDHYRFIAEVRHKNWNGNRNCGCYMHKNALKFWGVDQLVDEITNRLYDDYVKYYGESTDA